MLIRKLLFCTTLLLTSTLSQAELLRISGSGEITSSDYVTFSALSEPLPTLKFAFETVFDMNDFTPGFSAPGQAAFLYTNHMTAVEVNGNNSPNGFIRNGIFSGENHVFENRVNDPFGSTSGFGLSLGVSFEPSTRFHVDSNYFIREINVSGAIADLFATNLGIGSPDLLLDKILDNFSDFLTVRASVFLGEVSNTNDNTVAFGFVELGNNFNIKAELVPSSVSAPSPLAVYIFGALLLFTATIRQTMSLK